MFLKKFKKVFSGILPLMALLLSFSDVSGQVVKTIYQDYVFKSINEATTMPDKVYYLDLSGQNLTNIPEEIEYFPNLYSLNLSNNNTKEINIPEKSQFYKLRRLSLQKNRLTHVPDAVKQCADLVYLDLGENKIEIIETDINRCKSLVDLKIYQNRIQYWSPDITLPELKFLQISGNQISFLPGDFLSRLPSLKRLNLNQNKLGCLSFLTQYHDKLLRLDVGDNPIVDYRPLIFLPKLRELILDWNPLDGEDMNLITSLTYLEVLSLENCEIDVIPTSIKNLNKLRECSLIGNAVTQIPVEICNLKRLDKLWVKGNPVSDTNHKDLPDCIEKILKF